MNRRTLILAGAAAAVVLILYGLFAYAPLARRLGERREVMQAKQAELNQARDLVARFDAYQERAARIRMQAQRLSRRIPREPGVPELLKTITRAATTCNLEAFQFTPREPVETEVGRELPLTLTVTGSYHALGEFLTELAGAPRLMVAKTVKINRREGKQPHASIEAEIQMVAYVRKANP